MRWPKELLLEQAEAGSTTSGSTVSTPAASTPAATPAAPAPASTPAASNASEAGESDVDWVKESDLGDDNEVQPPAKPASAATAEPAKPASEPAAAKPAEAPKPAAAEPAKPAAEPAKPAAAEPAKPAPAAAETPEAKTAREAAEKAEDEKQFKALVDYYKLPEDLAAKLPTEPENVLPHLAATLHRTIARGVVNLLQTQLPSYLHHHGEVTRLNNEAKDEFYAAHPHLKGYEQQVLQAGQLYRQLNPTADRATSIKAIGKIVTDSLGLTVAGAPAAPAAAAVAAAAAPGFTPAGATGSRGPAPAAAKNEFEAMAEEDD